MYWSLIMKNKVIDRVKEELKELKPHTRRAKLLKTKYKLNLEGAGVGQQVKFEQMETKVEPIAEESSLKKTSKKKS